MRLSDEQVKEFQNIYKEKFGKDISEDEAREQGSKLIDFMKFSLGMK